jgi:hypothetical protein
MKIGRVHKTEVGGPERIVHQCEATWGVCRHPVIPTGPARMTGAR